MLQDHRPYLFKTSDYGATWTRIDGGLPRHDFTRVVREDPVRRGLLYAGTETTVHFSMDDGRTWAPLTRNLPNTPVHDLVVKEGDLVAATHGRGFWILDDVALLTQLAERSPALPAHLFRPRPTVRVSGRLADPQREDYPLGPDAFEAPNPPSGVLLRYFLREAPAGGVSLEILDAAGRTIRRYGPDTKPAPPGRAGMNRFEWDMRYPGPAMQPGTTLHKTPRGPRATPGRYVARLLAGDQRLEVPIEIRRDPRITATDADLAAQFRFLMELRDTLTETHAVVGRIRAMRAAALRSNRGAGAKEIADRLYSIEEQLTQYRARAAKDLSNFPSGLDNKLVVLQDLAARVDAAPTRASVERLAAHRATLAEQAGRLEALRAGAPWLAAGAAGEAR
jgi:hypothetical protein